MAWDGHKGLWQRLLDDFIETVRSEWPMAPQYYDSCWEDGYHLTIWCVPNMRKCFSDVNILEVCRLKYRLFSYASALSVAYAAVSQTPDTWDHGMLILVDSYLYSFSST